VPQSQALIFLECHFVEWKINQSATAMTPHVRKSRRSLLDRELRPDLQRESVDERLEEMLENVSLKDIPLEERRKEAKKPLYLTRYE
jgi:hypothetical protein